MPTTVYIPIDIRNPNVRSGFGGNSYWTVISGTDWDKGVWEFISGNQGDIYGTIHIPSIIAATPAPQISLVCETTSTSGLTNFRVATAAVASGATLDPTLTNETAYSVTVPSTALQRFDILFPSGTASLATTVSGNSVLIVEITHSGPTLTRVVEALLRVDLS